MSIEVMQNIVVKICIPNYLMMHFSKESTIVLTELYHGCIGSHYIALAFALRKCVFATDNHIIFPCKRPFYLYLQTQIHP